jgi:hypothetical protein
MIDDYTWDITYTDMYDDTRNFVVEKRFPDRVRIADLPRGFDLSVMNLEIEVYKMEKSWNAGGVASLSTQSNRKNTRLVHRTTINDISFDVFVGSQSGKRNVGTYMFRLRNTVTNQFSNFFGTKMKIKEFPVCQTNAALSLNDCVGYFKSTHLV